jgi:hypothetical protein
MKIEFFCFKTNGSKNDFMKNLYDHGILFNIVKFKNKL